MQIKRNNIILGCVLLISIFFLSEINFIYENSYSEFAKPYLVLSNLFTKTKNTEKSIALLNKAAEIYIKDNERKYSMDFHDSKVENLKFGNNQEASHKILEYLNKNSLDLYIDNSKLTTAKIYYDIGIILYTSGEKDAAKIFIKEAGLIVPTLSFLHIELSNLYFNEEKFEEGEKILKFCMEFDPPRKHCEEYLTENVPNRSFEEIGSFKEIIHEYLSN